MGRSVRDLTRDEKGYATVAPSSIMCTLALAWGVFADAPVLLAATRDEAFSRPSRPPDVLDEASLVVAPRDEEAGGTWIGHNEFGLVVAIANRWTDAEIDGERSRGLLVRDALGQSSAEEAARFVERELDRTAYEPYTLLLADPTAAVTIEWDGSRRIETLEPGVHVVTNVGVDGVASIPRDRPGAGEHAAAVGRRVLERLQPEPGEWSGAWLDRAAETLSDHEVGACVHRDRFGTRSASLLWVGTDRETDFRFADGPPCTVEFEPVNAESQD